MDMVASGNSAPAVAAGRRYRPEGRKRVIGAGNGTRTRDIKLGKLALYQLSYARPRPRVAGNVTDGAGPVKGHGSAVRWEVPMWYLRTQLRGPVEAVIPVAVWYHAAILNA
jgi:hypothetical protein